MKSTLQVPTLLLSTIAIVAGTGCGTTNAPEGLSRHFAPGVSPGLVMTQHQNAAGWEHGRHDERLNVGQQPVAAAGWADIRSWEYQRTSNGRPREQSMTYIRTRTITGPPLN